MPGRVSGRGRSWRGTCRRARIEPGEVAAVLMSPPCETYSVADASNQTRGNQFRDHKKEGRPPRSLASCESAASFLKRETAIKHDRMVKNLVESLMQRKQQGDRFEIVMENLAGSMSKQDFIRTGSWAKGIVQQQVHYCAYGNKYKKATHIWSTLKNWSPKGNTGNGLCGWKCGQLFDPGRHDSEKQSETAIRFGRRHKQAIGAEPSRLPKGPR